MLEYANIAIACFHYYRWWYDLHFGQSTKSRQVETEPSWPRCYGQSGRSGCLTTAATAVSLPLVLPLLVIIIIIIVVIIVEMIIVEATQHNNNGYVTMNLNLE